MYGDMQVSSARAMEPAPAQASAVHSAQNARHSGPDIHDGLSVFPFMT
jgi:hypothetical protein